jgi:hypothetical protein
MRLPGYSARTVSGVLPHFERIGYGVPDRVPAMVDGQGERIEAAVQGRLHRLWA